MDARSRTTPSGTVENRQHYLERFTVLWCIERGITQLAEVTKALLERYQRHLYHYRKENGQPLTFGSQFTTWFRCGRSSVVRPPESHALQPGRRTGNAPAGKAPAQACPDGE